MHGSSSTRKNAPAAGRRPFRTDHIARGKFLRQIGGDRERHAVLVIDRDARQTLMVFETIRERLQFPDRMALHQRRRGSRQRIGFFERLTLQIAPETAALALHLIQGK